MYTIPLSGRESLMNRYELLLLLFFSFQLFLLDGEKLLDSSY